MNAIASFVAEHPTFSQCMLFAGVVVSLWLIERAATAQPADEKLKHTSLNLLYMLALLPGQLLLMALCLMVASWCLLHHWGLVYLLPYAEHPLVRFGVMFFALDLLDYTYHYCAHRFAPLWQLHSLHHSDKAVDVSTTFRENPIETLVRVSFLTCVVFITGASVEVLVLRQTVETFANVSQHTVFRLPPRAARIAGWLFVTPNLHHIHHHWKRPGTDCNYGDVFSIWDRLFGTYIEFPTEEIVFGLDSQLDRHPDEWLLRKLKRIIHLGAETGLSPDQSPSSDGVHSIAV